MSDTQTAVAEAVGEGSVTETEAPMAAVPAVPQAQEEPVQEQPSSNANINALSLADEPITDDDPEADIDEKVLPHDGVVVLKLKLGKKGVYGPYKDNEGNDLKEPKMSNGRPFFVADVEMYITSE